MNKTELVEKQGPIKGIGSNECSDKTALKLAGYLTGCFVQVNEYSQAGWPVHKIFSKYGF